MSIGIILASIWYLCNSNENSANHLFFECSFAKFLSNWFRRNAWFHSNPNSMEHWFHIFSSNLSNQYGIVLKDAIIFTINEIWVARNKFKYDNLRPNRRYSINLIHNQTMIFGNNSINLSYISIMDFALIKAFKVQIRPSSAPNIT